METSNKKVNNPKVYTVRGKRVVLDREIAALIGIETKYLNRIVKRNSSLFEGDDIRLELTGEECSRCQIVTLNNGRGSNIKYLPYAFTEEGVRVLEKVLKRSIPIEFEEPAEEADIIEESWSEGTVVLYQPNDEIKLDVRVENETVWLTQEQMAVLLGTTRSNVARHINNIFKENELEKSSVCEEYSQTAADGKRYIIQAYDLDVIISVGYRVKSVQGTRFRQWATRVLNGYLRSHSQLEYRVSRIEIENGEIRKELKEVRESIEFMVNANIRKETLLLNGQNLEANLVYTSIYKLARHSIIVVDDYIDAKTLSLLHGVPSTVQIHIISDCKGFKDFTKEVERYRREHPELNIELHSSCGRFHDRYIFIDFKDPKNEHLYHCGASSKDAGNKITTIDEINDRTVYYPLFDELLR